MWTHKRRVKRVRGNVINEESLLSHIKPGRKCKYPNDKSERYVVSLILKNGDMDRLLKRLKIDKKSQAISLLIEKELSQRP